VLVDLQVMVANNLVGYIPYLERKIFPEESTPSLPLSLAEVPPSLMAYSQMVKPPQIDHTDDDVVVTSGGDSNYNSPHSSVTTSSSYASPYPPPSSSQAPPPTSPSRHTMPLTSSKSKKK